MISKHVLSFGPQSSQHLVFCSKNRAWFPLLFFAVMALKCDWGNQGARGKGGAKGAGNSWNKPMPSCICLFGMYIDLCVLSCSYARNIYCMAAWMWTCVDSNRFRLSYEDLAWTNAPSIWKRLLAHLWYDVLVSAYEECGPIFPFRSMRGRRSQRDTLSTGTSFMNNWSK